LFLPEGMSQACFDWTRLQEPSSCHKMWIPLVWG
jgi:hypothetical protein